MEALKYEGEESTAKKWMPTLIIGILGLGGSIGAFYFAPQLFGRRFQPIELLMMFIVAGFTAAGYIRRITRGITTLVAIYLATGIAALLYQIVTPFIGGVLEAFKLNLDATRAESVSPGSLAFSFSLLTTVIWIILEILIWATLKETKIAALGVLDNLGGVLVHLALGMLVATLLFNLVGYGRSRPTHDAALLRRTFNQVLYVHYTAQQFWFKTPPPIYTYDLNVR